MSNFGKRGRGNYIEFCASETQLLMCKQWYITYRTRLIIK